jgi:Periplasmic protein TonB, links inner and outer membranes
MQMRTGMRTMVKAMSLLAVLSVTVLLLAACGGKSTAEPTPTAKVTVPPTAEAEPTKEPGVPTPTEREPVVVTVVPVTPEPVTPKVVLPEDGEMTYTAVYRGVKDYGAPETKKENIGQFLYRFDIGGTEWTLPIDNSETDADGNPTYSIQNRLKEGYNYRVSVKDKVVVGVEEIPDTAAEYKSVVTGKAGERTLLNFIKTAFMPVGTTLYVYGGGWDWQDVGSSIQARTIGVSGDWVRFFNEQDENYTFRDRDDNKELRDPTTSYYPFGEYNEYYYAGLDCSGYVGWTIYNTMETADGAEGYVCSSTKMAGKMADRGWGHFTQELMKPADDASAGANKISADGRIPDLKPGDVVSIKGHVWISLGTCDDGSVVIVHSTNGHVSRTGQPGGGVAIGAIGLSEDCEAYRLADEYMSKYYGEWYRRYDTHLCSPDTYMKIEGEVAGRFRWDTESGKGLTDEEHVQDMTPSEVLKMCFKP